MKTPLTTEVIKLFKFQVDAAQKQIDAIDEKITALQNNKSDLVLLKNIITYLFKQNDINLKDFNEYLESIQPDRKS